MFLIQLFVGSIKADEVDSLLRLIKISKSDTQKVRLYGSIVNLCEINEIPKYAALSFKIIEKQKLTVNNPNYIFFETERARLYNNIGFYYYENLNALKTLENYQKAILILEKINGDEDLLASLYNNITAQYSQLKLYGKIIPYMQKVIAIDLKNNNEKMLALDYNNLAAAYRNLNKIDSALFYFEKSLTLRIKGKDALGEVTTLLNIGNIYQTKKELTKAEYYINIAETKANSLKNTSDSSVYTNLYYWKGVLNHQKNDLQKAEKFLQKSLGIAKRNKNYINLGIILSELYKINKENKDYKNALQFYEAGNALKDSTANADIAKESELKNLKFDYDKKEILTKVENEKQLAIEKEKQTRQKYFILFTFVIIVLGGVSFVIIYNRWKLVSKQKVVIESQKDLLNEQHQDLEKTHEQLHKKNITITDSIDYALSIQQALLTDEVEAKEITSKDCFILFKPKDVVSGDFYWIKKFGSKTIWIVADCTGHGVPGAFISLLAIKSIENYFLSEQNVNDPKGLLNHIHKEFLSSFEQSKETGIGVELVLCCLDSDNNVLTCCGSSNNVLIANGTDLQENKFPSLHLGKINHTIGPVEEVFIKLKKGDAIYLTTDGLIDQVGGPQNRKFYSKRLKDLILEFNTLDCKTQKENIEKNFTEWVGKKQQYDDVTLFCIKI